MVRQSWGVHPITMEVEKSLADIYLKVGTLKVKGGKLPLAMVAKGGITGKRINV